MKRLILSAACLLMSVVIFAQETPTKVTSPDGKFEISVWLKGNAPVYTVNFEGKPIILESQLGIESRGDWAKDVKLLGVETSSNNSTWKPPYGERAEIRNNYNQAVIHLQKISAPSERLRTKLDIIVRTYNEGVAFRYMFAGTLNVLHITGENTQFTLPEGTMAYFTPRAQSKYLKWKLDPAVWKDRECERPLVLELPDGNYAALGEAQVVDYVRTKFTLSPTKPNTIACSMYGEVDEIEPFYSPWRLVMAAKTPGKLLENNFIYLNLNAPCAITDTKWIKPGKMMREVKLTTDGAMKLIDFAAARNLQYILFDGRWNGPSNDKSTDASTFRGNIDIPGVIAYAKSKGIGVWLYVDQRALSIQLDDILNAYQKVGAAGIKFGFVQVGSHRWTTWLHEAIKKCAEHKLMVDIHDEWRPTGFERTYPNLLTQEGIHGNEEYPDANTNVTLPFTRFLCGPADYTICYYTRDFSQYDPNEKPNYHKRPDRVIKATPAHQLAMAVVYYSPLQAMYWYDKPEDYKGEPEIEFFDRVPTVWDDSKVLDGRIGEYIAMARRSGNDWYLGAMNGDKEREMTIALDFLTPGKKYEAKIFADGPMSIPTRTKVSVETRSVNSKTILKLPLKATGGAAIWITPSK